MSSEHALFEFKRFAAFQISSWEIGSSSSLYEESLPLSELSKFIKKSSTPGFSNGVSSLARERKYWQKSFNVISCPVSTFDLFFNNLQKFSVFFFFFFSHFVHLFTLIIFLF